MLQKISTELHQFSRAFDDGNARYRAAMDVMRLVHHAEEYLVRVEEFCRAQDDLVTQSLLTLGLINLRDGLQKLATLKDFGGNWRVDRKGPLIQHKPARRDVESGDLTTLISAARAAACHIESGHARLPDGGGLLRWFWLGPGNGVMMNGRGIRNETQDDIMIAFGDVELYFQNNLIRAVKDAHTACYGICGHKLTLA